jgi:hypothetical protein
MKSWIFAVATFVLAAGGLNSPSNADDVTVSVPGNTKFVLQLDLQAFRATAFGGKLLEVARKKAMKELSEEGNEGGKAPPNFDKIQEMLGFDPFGEIQGIIVSASDYERPEKSLVVSVRMRKTTGNLEGLILGLPGYEATDYGKYRIHSAAPEKDMHVFGTIHTDGKGDKTVLLSSQREAVTRLLDHLDGKPAGDASFKKIKLGAEGKPLLALEILELPTDVIGDGPHANVARLLHGLSLRISESKGNLDIGLSLTAGAEQQAEQLRQMAQGLIAMLDFAQSANPDDEDLKKVQRLAHDIKAARDGSSLKISLSVPAEELTKFIEGELGDH